MNPTRLLLCALAIVVALPVFGQSARRRKADRARESERVWAEIQAQRDAIVEQELARRRPIVNNGTSVPQDVLCVATDLSGVWRRHSGFEGAYLKLYPLGDGRYKALFRSYSCDVRWSLKRTGTYRNGVLTLDRPVAEDIETPYRRLFTIKTKSGVRLISEEMLSSAPRIGARSLRDMPEYFTFGNQTRTVKTLPNTPLPKPSASVRAPRIL